MFEKVNPCHPDKLADRIAGALVDLAYAKSENPKIAVEVLIGHGECHIIAETSTVLDMAEVKAAVKRIAGRLKVDYKEVAQDIHLAVNQADKFRCGDNGIFKGVPVTEEQMKLADIARTIFAKYPSDGKYILDGKRLIICYGTFQQHHLASLEHLLLYNQQTNPVKRKLIMDDINKANMFTTNNVVDTEFYLLFKERDMDKIQKKIRNLIQSFANAGLNATQTSNDDLRVILDNFLNGGTTTTFGTVMS